MSSDMANHATEHHAADLPHLHLAQDFAQARPVCRSVCSGKLCCKHIPRGGPWQALWHLLAGCWKLCCMVTQASNSLQGDVPTSPSAGCCAVHVWGLPCYSCSHLVCLMLRQMLSQAGLPHGSGLFLSGHTVCSQAGLKFGELHPLAAVSASCRVHTVNITVQCMAALDGFLITVEGRYVVTQSDECSGGCRALSLGNRAAEQLPPWRSTLLRPL